MWCFRGKCEEWQQLILGPAKCTPHPIASSLWPMLGWTWNRDWDEPAPKEPVVCQGRGMFLVSRKWFIHAAVWSEMNPSPSLSKIGYSSYHWWLFLQFISVEISYGTLNSSTPWNRLLLSHWWEAALYRLVLFVQRSVYKKAILDLAIFLYLFGLPIFGGLSIDIWLYDPWLLL